MPLLLLPLLFCVVFPSAYAEDEPAPPAAPKEEPAKPKSAGPEVKLLEAGAEPRSQLRYKPTAGAKFAITTRMTMKIESAMMPPMDIPPFVGTWHVAVPSVNDKAFTVEGELTDYKLDGDDAMGMGGMMGVDAMKGMKAKGTYSKQGMLESFEASGAENVPAMGKQLKSGLVQRAREVVVPLPTEAIGVGAKWEIKTAQSTQTWELKTLTGDKLELALTFTQKQGKRKIESQMGTIEVIKAETTGTATGNVDLTAGILGKYAQKSKTTTSMNMGGQAIDTTTQLELTMEAKAAAATTPSSGG